MKRVSKLIGGVAVLATVFLTSSFKSTTVSSAGGICVIVNAENPVAPMSADEAKLYYLRKIKKRWPVINKNILPADRANTCPERVAFYDKVLKMDAASIDKYFSQREYENAEPNRKLFKNDAEMVQYVADNPGAIGFVSEASSKAAGVKVILTVQ